jgi:hypothetical protein
MIDIYVMIWNSKSLNLKTILRPSIVGGMPLKRTHVVPSLNFKCTPRASCMQFDSIIKSSNTRTISMMKMQMIICVRKNIYIHI